jgi:hypothetical protein
VTDTQSAARDCQRRRKSARPPEFIAESEWPDDRIKAESRTHVLALLLP